VAQAFIPNPLRRPEVNHKDENKRNNDVENLEWASVWENRNYGTRNIRARDNKNYAEISKKVAAKRGKPVVQIDRAGKTINVFKSIRDANRKTGYARSIISSCCRGRCRYGYGYQWAFVPPRTEVEVEPI
jgi:hypothetical protein